MNNKLILSLTGLILMSGITLAPEPAFGNCDSEGMKLKIWKRGLKLTPANGPKCLYVADLKDVDTQFTIKLRPRRVTLENGDVTLTQVSNKTSGCGSNLTLGGHLSNSGNNDMVVTVKGNDVEDNETVCFEIDVKDIGMLDPRARVREQSLSSKNIALELNELLGAHDILIDSDLGAALAGVSLDEFLRDAFDMNEIEARNFIQKYLGK